MGELVACYERYRALGPPPEVFSLADYAERQGIEARIGELLAAGWPSDDATVCAVLRAAVCYPGYESSAPRPLELAKKAFRERPYSAALFGAVAAYLDGLKGLISVQAQMAKKEAAWILWWDGGRRSKPCWSGRMRADFAVMEAGERWGWEWMLRHTNHGIGAKRGKQWLAEAERRFAAVGAVGYQRRVESWFVFGESAERLTPEGSQVLRLVVSYGSLAPGAWPALVRLREGRWARPELAAKALASLQWVEQQLRS